MCSCHRNHKTSVRRVWLGSRAEKGDSDVIISYHVCILFWWPVYTMTIFDQSLFFDQIPNCGKHFEIMGSKVRAESRYYIINPQCCIEYSLPYPCLFSQLTLLQQYHVITVKICGDNSHLAFFIISYSIRCNIDLRTLRNLLFPFHFISFHIISYHIISYHIISYHIISYHILSYHIISYHIISYYTILGSGWVSP